MNASALLVGRLWCKCTEALQIFTLERDGLILPHSLPSSLCGAHTSTSLGRPVGCVLHKPLVPKHSALQVTCLTYPSPPFVPLPLPSSVGAGRVCSPLTCLLSRLSCRWCLGRHAADRSCSPQPADGAVPRAAHRGALPPLRRPVCEHQLHPRVDPVAAIRVPRAVGLCRPRHQPIYG